jgi:hypothetical protein
MPQRSPIPTPTLSGILRPFTVRVSDSRVVEMILRLLCAVLLLAVVVFVVLGVVQGNGDNGYFAGAFGCGVSLLLLGWILYVWARNRVEVNQWGVLITKVGKSRSVLWDQLNDVTVEVAEGPEGKVRYLVQLVFHTPTGEVRSAPGLDTTRCRVRQLAPTIRSYRDHIRAGTAKWVSTASDDASAH